MKNLNAKNIYLFGEWYDLFWFHSCYFDGIIKEIKDKFGFGLTQVISVQEDNIQRMYFSRTEWENLGEKYLEQVINDPDDLKSILDDTRNTADELFEISNKLKKVDPDKLSQANLIKWLEKYHVSHHRLWSLGMIPNVIELDNSFLTDYLKDWLSKKNLSENDNVKIFQILVTPSELSMAQQEEREILQLATKKNPTKELKKHWQKYSWLQFGWIGPSLSLDYFKKNHQELYAKNNARKKLNQILDRDNKLIKDKKFYIKKLETPKEIENLFRLLEEILFVKAHRMDALYKSYEAIWPLLNKISKDNHLSIKQVYIQSISWIIKALKNNSFDVSKLNKLSKLSIRYFDGNKYYLLLDKEAENISNKVKKYLPKSNNKDELKGECGFPGKVRGKVTIVNLASEMKKFKEGDILVSYSTDPSLLPVMKKAKAFVTNIGGLTCHAAIVARETETPCIVGTKIATKVFKDGDMVEVDATKGTVRKI